MDRKTMNYEEAQEISSSGIWDKVCKELDRWIEVELDKLKYCVPEQLTILQNTISTLEKVKRMPSIVKDAQE